jgi:hypothetical protein
VERKKATFFTAGPAAALFFERLAAATASEVLDVDVVTCPTNVGLAELSVFVQEAMRGKYCGFVGVCGSSAEVVCGAHVARTAGNIAQVIPFFDSDGYAVYRHLLTGSENKPVYAMLMGTSYAQFPESTRLFGGTFLLDPQFAHSADSGVEIGRRLLKAVGFSSLQSDTKQPHRLC